MSDSNTPNVGANTGGAWNQDFSGNLNEILAPYQRIAQQMYSPYATMRPQGWLPQHHPALAGALDNAFLAMGMTPQPQGPEGVGGGITRTMQGLLGAQQYRRQQIMQQAMLPYQMAMGQLQAADISSQIQERRAKAPLEMALTEKAISQSGMYTDLERHRQALEDLDRQKMLSTINPSELMDREARIRAGVAPNADINALSPDQLTKYSGALDDIQARRARSTGSEFNIIQAMKSSPDAAIREEGNRRWTDYLQSQSALAGARAGAVQGATQPTRDYESFIQKERANTLSNYDATNRVQGFSDWQMLNMGSDPDALNPQKMGTAYQNYVQSIQGQRQQVVTDLDKYERTDAPKKGVGFGEYMKNRSKWDTPNAPTVAAPSGAGTGIVNYDAQGNPI